MILVAITIINAIIKAGNMPFDGESIGTPIADAKDTIAAISNLLICPDILVPINRILTIRST
jgi:hypothetical protein